MSTENIGPEDGVEITDEQRRANILSFIRNAKQNPECFYAGIDFLEEVEAVLTPKPSTDDARALPEPIAYMHVMTYESGDTNERLDFEKENPWGKQGIDYSKEFSVKSTPLYAALQQREPIDVEEPINISKLKGQVCRALIKQKVTDSKYSKYMNKRFFVYVEKTIDHLKAKGYLK